MRARWILSMAWRDSRRNRSRLFLFISSIILGIASLVAIYSFEDNLKRDFDAQAKELLGADLIIESNKEVSDDIRPLLDSIGVQRSEERTFASMVYFPSANGTRLVNIKALGGEFPYYGTIQTDPAGASVKFRSERSALVDKTLMLQFNARPGDSIRVGEITFLIQGVLEKAPGQSGFASSIAPIVYIPLKYLESTGLLQKGSRINYNYYYKLSEAQSAEKLIEGIKDRLERSELDYETVESRKRNASRSFDDLAEFLSLTGFIALLLGCVGVASAIYVYIKEKIASVAILRCLGTSANQAFMIFLVQISGFGLFGSIVGAGLGTLIQQILPSLLQEFLPVELSVAVSWNSILQGTVLGFVISILFALLSLVSLRNVSPLSTLRAGEPQIQGLKDPLKWLVYGLILAFIFFFTWLQVESVMKTVFFTAGLLISFLILTGLAYLIIWLSRRFIPSGWSYLWRQGLSNLFRPNNQTLTLIVSIGLGTAFICTLYFVQGILINKVSLSSGAGQPNMVLFDIQTSQKEAVSEFTKSMGLPVLQVVPVVNMRMTRLKGLTSADLRKDSSNRSVMRGLEREYRVTYRDSLSDSEKIVEGNWYGTAAAGDEIYVSMEKNFAKRMEVKVGDKLEFNVQGMPLEVIVGSLREVDWNRVQTNFLLIFPKGVLEEAPQFHVLLTRVPNETTSAGFQSGLVSRYPNISVVDLGLVLQVLDEILTKMGFVIKFMAGFSILTGLIVLITSVMISKFQRMKESVLLRTIGASRRQVFGINAIEYFLLGTMASGTGIIISLSASWALAYFSFETVFKPDLAVLVLIYIGITAITVFVGLINTRGVVNRPPLEVLRYENA